MFVSKLKVLKSHGWQTIDRLERVRLPEIFRGRPELKALADEKDAAGAAAMCPVGAIGVSPLSIDMGKCVFCNECAMRYPGSFRFTPDFRTASNVRENLVVSSLSQESVTFDEDSVRREVKRLFGRALKLRQVSAGGDNSTEMELNASMNVNFDFGRYGVDFVASPRHADGVVITGPLTENMNQALHTCYDAIAQPKIIILAGTDAISGGLFEGSRAVNRSFLDAHTADLYVPGNPVHPLTFIDGVRNLVGNIRRSKNGR